MCSVHRASGRKEGQAFTEFGARHKGRGYPCAARWGSLGPGPAGGATPELSRPALRWFSFGLIRPPRSTRG